MTNNQFCDFIGITGCLIIFFSMGFMFFGLTSALITAILGVVISLFALANYDNE